MVTQRGRETLPDHVADALGMIFILWGLYGRNAEFQINIFCWLDSGYQKGTSNTIAHKIFSRYVSAKILYLIKAPPLLKNDKHCHDDKLTCDSNYHEEYQSLADIDTSKLITNEEY